jgi:hypothetical protein
VKLEGFILLLLSVPLHAADHALGRLFFTPAERAQLDRARASGALGQPRAKNRTSVNDDDASLGRMRLHGVVLRSDGQQTSWIGGRRVHSRHDASEELPDGLSAGSLPSRTGAASALRTTPAAPGTPDQGSIP